MKNITFKHLAGIKVTTENCDEIQEEAMRLFMKALRVNSAKIQSEHMSMQIKRGLQARREKLSLQQELSR
jgi:hypothetical protein